MANRLVEISKTVSYALQHNPGEFGLVLDPQGRVNLMDLIGALRKRTKYKDVTVQDITPPVADAGPARFVEQHGSVRFDGGASVDNVGVVNWTWTLTYNGTIVTLYGPEAEFTFHIPGEYDVILNVTDARGLWDEDHVTIYVMDMTDPGAVAPDDLTVDQHEVVILDGTRCTDNVAVVNWTWSFVYRGTPMTIYGEMASFTFDDAGSFKVTLSVSDAAGNRGIAVFHVTVVDTTPPIADAGEDREVDPGTTMFLDGSGSSDNVGIASYEWTFTHQGQEIHLDGVATSYLLKAARTYAITLKVTDTEGNTAVATVKVTVPDLESPTAEAGENVTVDQGASVTMDASGSTDNVGIVAWSWSLQVDGELVTSEEASWEYEFVEVGTYEVHLHVEDAAGRHAEDTMTVTVMDTTAPIATIVGDITSDQGEEITFNGSASIDNVGIVQWAWVISYGDSDLYFNGKTISHTFMVPGEGIVNLTVVDAAGNTDSSNLNFKVTDNVAPYLPRLRDIDTGIGDKVTFDGTKATDNVGVVSWTWTFEDGGRTVTLEGAQVEHTFEEPGEYQITLTVVDADGNEAAETFTVTVSGGAWMYVVITVAVVAVVMAVMVIMRMSRG